MNRYPFLFLSIIIILISSCKKDISTTELQGYPDGVGEIMVKKCATSGCHNEASKSAVGGLSLETWDKLFEGAKSGSVVIPFRAENSSLCYFINTFSDLGISLSPTMPVNGAVLSRDEVKLIQSWINSGAPSVNGKIACRRRKTKQILCNQSRLRCDNCFRYKNKTRDALL